MMIFIGRNAGFGAETHKIRTN